MDFESRATDPRKPSTIPLQERMARQGLDDNLEGIFLEYVKGDLSQDEYLRDLESQIANAKKYGFPESSVQYVIDRNTDANLDFLDYTQFYADDVFTGDRVAREAAIYQGKVPFGAEGDSGLYHTLGSGGIYNTRAFLRRKMGDPDQIYFSGKSSTSPIVYHEGYHSTNTPLYKYVDEEEGIRGLDYYRGLATGDKKLMEQSLPFFDDPSQENIRTAAISTVLGVDDKTLSDYNNLEMETLSDYYESTLDKEGVSGIAETLGGLVGLSVSDLASETRPDFEDIIKNATDEEFVEFLKVAPAYETQASSLINPKPRSVIRGYEIGGEVESSIFDQQPGYSYGMILPVSRNVETGEKGFDLAGGVTGAVGRGIGVFEDYLSGAPVSDEQLVAAGLDVIPTSAGIANVAAPAAAPGILGTFYAKHASPRFIQGKLKPTGEADPTMGTSVAGPGVYMSETTDDILEYALKEADRKAPTEADEAYNVGRSAESKNEALEAFNEQAINQAIDVQNGKRYYFMKDGSLVVDNFKTGEIERRGKGQGYIYNALVDANKDEFFDFRKPLGEQSKKVQDALRPLRLDLNLSSGDRGDRVYQRLKGALGGETAANQYLSSKGLAGNIFNLRNKETLVVFDADKLDVNVVQPVSNVGTKKFANGGGVGTLAPQAKGMFSGPRGVGSMSAMARNMFRS